MAQVNPDGSKFFTHTDNQGNIVVVSNSSGQGIENTSYSPFGEVISGGDSSRYTYEAKEYDDTLGTFDFHFRQYNPSLGMFTQPDTLIQNVYDPQSLNRYMFERGNSYFYIDENGHVTALVYVGIGAVLVGAGWYWLTHPVDKSNPQWGQRFEQGMKHGINAGVHAILALTFKVNSAGRVIIGGASVAKSVVAAVSQKFWSHNIEGTQTNVAEMSSTIVSSALTSGLPTFAGEGQYVSINTLYTPQNYNMFNDYLANSFFSSIIENQANEALSSAQKSKRTNSGNSETSNCSSSGGQCGVNMSCESNYTPTPKPKSGCGIDMSCA